MQSSWAREQLAALEAEGAEEGAAPQYSLNFLWLAKNIAVSVDQVFKAVRLILFRPSAPICLQSRRRPWSMSCGLHHIYGDAGTAQPLDRVLLLAAKRRLGGAENIPRNAGLDLRQAGVHSSFSCLKHV